MRSGSATVSSYSPAAVSAALARWMTCAGEPVKSRLDWRMCSLRSPETAAFRPVPVRPLIAKELREVLNGRALWTMLILLCPLVGYSFFQAAALYGEASAAARDSPAMASGLSPLDRSE